MRVFLGVTGASGAIYGARALRALTAAGCEVGVCVSGAGAQVIGHEILGTGPRLDRPAREVAERFVEMHATGPGTAVLLDPMDLATPFASGSARVPAALIAPCSMSTLAVIAHGAGQNLIHRCADVMLKERRRLVLIPRETPLSLVHLDNMTRAMQAGAVILPAMPGLYTLPRTVEEMVDFVVGKALDQLGLEHSLLRRWGEDAPVAAS